MPTQIADRRALLSQARQAATTRRYGEASTLLEQLLEANPMDIEALDMLGFVRFFEGRYEDSKACCERVLALSPSHAYAHKGLGLNLARLGQLEEGVAHLRTAMALKPEWEDPYHDLALVLANNGRIEQALAVLDEWTTGGKVATEGMKGLRKRLLGKGQQGKRT